MKHAIDYHDEGRESDACREVTERLLSGPWGWLLLTVAGAVVALAFNGGYL